jgi:hypothetical protein
MKFKILFLIVLSSAFSWGQATLPVSRTIWTGVEPLGWSQNATTDRTTVSACSGNDASIFDATNDATTVNYSGSANTLTFKLKKQSLTGSVSKMTVEESPDGTSWTLIGDYGAASPQIVIVDCADIVVTLLSSSRFVKWTYTKGTGNCDLDDVSITSLGPVPTITLGPTTLSGFTYVFGSGPSAEQSFLASGTNLTGNITLNAPTNYEISTTSGSGFSNTITLIQSAGNVANTTVYVRLKSGLTVNAYNESVTATSSGATNKTVAITGTVTGSTQSDIVAIAGSEAAIISSTINNPAPLSATTGVNVWQFKVRDGGATLNDSDTLPTILNAFTLAQNAGNSVSTWSDAINTVALFDGATYLASGTVTANQIQFSGLSISVTDNTEKTLSLRLSLKCPLGAGAVDGNDFVFSLSNANTTFSALGSGKATFSAQISANGSNVISVIATQLALSAQPVTTGVNGPMSPAVQVKATDICGNFDSGFNGVISVTSSGALATSPIVTTAINGIATFSSIIHTVSGTGYVLYATATGLTGTSSATFDINNTTVLQPGDIAILAFNTGIASGEDEISFVTLVDVLPGTRIDITDNAYQKCGTPNGWGISEGWIRIERANTTLPKGTIVTIRIDLAGFPIVFSPDPTNWISSKPHPSSQGKFDLNSNGEQIFFMTGGNVGGTNATIATSDGGTYSGIFLFGFNTKGNVWTPMCANSAGGGSQNSDKPLNFDCFLTWPTAQADLNKYTGLITPATKRDWIERINNPTNWTGYSNNIAYDAGPNYYSGSITIDSGGFSDGVWVGNSSTNWFECGNWQSLKVPNETVNVVIGSNATQLAKIDYTAPYSDLFLDIAKCNDLTISNLKLEIIGDNANQLKVFGNCKIETSGILDMDDSNAATADGQLFLYGNWTNTSGNTAFEEGNGVVNFVGSTPQIINNVTPEGTEVFYNVVLDNNFDTAVSNDLIAQGNLVINSGKAVNIDSNGYIRVNKKLTHNGNLNIASNGQFIQVDESDTNDGDYSGTKFQVNRSAQVKHFDYVYWSTPTENFNITSLPTNNRYEWNTLFANVNGTFGNWALPTTATMSKGKGYIARASNGATIATTLTTNFIGKPNNGQFTYPIYRGNYSGADYDADLTNATNLFTTALDDNWNLIGNPYPSAIDAEEFLVLNQTKIMGSIWVWKHGLDPSSSVNPFYANFIYNYSSSDYIKFNGLGSTEPDSFAGKIASGQGFMVNMLDVNPSGTAINFTNDLRSGMSNSVYDNTDFFRNSSSNPNPSVIGEEKHRIWLDIINNQSGQMDRTLLGYSTNSTLFQDNLYDCVFRPRSEVSLYSLINSDPYTIQGRPLPFNSSDVVPMGIKIASAGAHTIAIKKVDGLFNMRQQIYLEDKLLRITHNLKNSPYFFTSNEGVFNDRFVIKYNDFSITTAQSNLIISNVKASAKENQISVNSVYETMISVVVYDILGREIVRTENVSENEIRFTNIAVKNQTLIVKIKLKNGEIVTRKIIL